MPHNGFRRAASITTGAALLLFVSGPVAAHPDDSAGPDTVPGRYLVRLDPEAAVTAEQLATRYGGAVGHVYDTALSGFSVSLDDAAARRLAADPAVDDVEAVRTVATDIGAAAPAGQPGLDRIDQRALPLDGQYTHPESAGSGVTTYVIDTGVRLSHQEFTGRAVAGPDFADDDDDPADCLGNGTAIADAAAGTEYGVAEKSTVVGVRVLDCSGAGTTEDVVAAVDWVADDAAGKPAVAVIGFGGANDGVLDDAVAGAVAAGVTFAVPAGSSDSDACGFSPGRVATALTVGGTVTGTDARMPRSNTGGCLDLFAPGTDLTVAAHTGDFDTVGYSGTAAAAAHAAGAAALYLGEHPTADPATVAAALTDNATEGVVTDPGANSPNLLLYTGFMNG